PTGLVARPRPHARLAVGPGGVSIGLVGPRRVASGQGLIVSGGSPIVKNDESAKVGSARHRAGELHAARYAELLVKGADMAAYGRQRDAQIVGDRAIRAAEQHGDGDFLLPARQPDATAGPLDAGENVQVRAPRGLP